jgi:tetratricopeptide (TPR) repeat protein
MNELVEYIKHPTSDDAIFNLGLYYESIKQYSAAASFYLKCAELTAYTNFRYECLLRLYLCLDQLKDRDHTCECILKQAISLCPDYGIAYFFLTQIYERKQDWSSVYLFSCIGLQKKESLHSTSKFDYDYYYLYFQKAAASWWLGKADESRSTYKHILNCYFDSLTEPYVKLLESNLCSLGSGPPSLCMHTYTRNQSDQLRYKFKDVSKIEKNFSQVYQDLFVLSILDGKHNGTYLEIGSAEPFYGSNTALLETVFSWTGVGIEYDKTRSDQHTSRKNPVVCVDATSIDYNKFLPQYFNDPIIDYLQLDIEPSRNTFLVLHKIPFDKYKFKVVTYEHDNYIDIHKKYRNESRDYLRSLGYELIVNDVSPREDCSFEDWWIYPDLVDTNIIKYYKHLLNNKINLAPNIVFA